MRTVGLICSIALVCAVAGCDDPPKPAAPTASAKPSAKASAASTAKAQTPKPLDVATLKKTLKCNGGGHGPCLVLNQFKECDEWNPVSQSGDARYLGQGFVVDKGAFTEELTLIRSKRVALDQVGAGQLGAKISVTNIPDDRADIKTNANKAIKAFARGDVPTPLNNAVKYIKSREDWPDAFSMQAEDNQVYVAVSGGAYLCAHKNGQEVLLVKRSGDREHAADGVYATMWPVSW